MATTPVLHGVVSSFSSEDGLGQVMSVDGDTFPFHCTAIADGSRTIDVGAAVSFGLVPGHLGRLEARPVAVVDRDASTR